MSQKLVFKQLENILLGAMQARTISLAMRFRIFELLYKRPLDFQEIASLLDIKNEKALQKLLQALQNINLLDFDGCKYVNSKVASTTFARFLMAEIELRTTANLFAEIKDDRPAPMPKHSESDWLLYMQAMQEIGELCAGRIAKLLCLEKSKTLCDVGSGPGTYALAFAKIYPHLRVTLFDVAPSLQIAQKNLSSTSCANQFRFVAGSVTEANWGGTYDTIFLSHVIHLFEPSMVLKIFKTAKSSLNQAGKLFVRDLFIDREKSSVDLGTFLSLCVWNQGGAYTQSDIESLLQQGGFTKINAVTLSKEENAPQVIGSIIEAAELP